MSEIVIINTNEAYSIDVSAISDVLTSGLYVKESSMVVKGFDSLEHAISIVTDADAVKALHIVYSVGGYAIWKVYKQPENEPEAFHGYLIISMSDDTIASIDGDNVLGDDEIAAVDFATAMLNYFASEDRASYEDSDEVTDSIDTAKTKVRIEIEP
jgi:hypothetical protein